MKKTRAEVLRELRHRLGASEHTEHLIDWLLDMWETRDFLHRLLGREYTTTIIEAVESCATDTFHEHVLYEFPLEDANFSSLN